MNQELRALPRKGIYREEIYTTSRVVDQLDYTLPSGTFKVEKVEVNTSTSAQPYWVPVAGWDNYGGALHLSSRPTDTYTMRVFIRKGFTNNGTTIDIEDPEADALIFGIAARAYKALLGYFVDAKNWDTVAKPDGISANQVLALYREAKVDYRDALSTYRKYPMPRSVDMVG